jgi:hypothetical protein
MPSRETSARTAHGPASSPARIDEASVLRWNDVTISPSLSSLDRAAHYCSGITSL